MTIFLITFLLIFWLIVLAKWADVFIDNASILARKFKLSEVFIGLTIVAFGTSMPEFFVNAQSAFHWHTDMALGNIIGSNIANIGLILWCWITLWSIYIKKDIRKDILISIGFSLLLLLLSFFWENAWVVKLEYISWALLLVCFLCYFIYSYKNNSHTFEDNTEILKRSTAIVILLIVIWLIAVIGWSELVVQNAIKIANIFWISDKVIGLTIIAIWTSLPELVTTIISLKKWHNDMAVGNIVWSNIFNVGLILWTTISLYPIITSKTIYIDLIIMILLMAILSVYAFFSTQPLKKWQWLLLLGIYVVYLFYTV